MQSWQKGHHIHRLADFGVEIITYEFSRPEDRHFSRGRTTGKNMSIYAGVAEFSRIPLQKKISVSLLSWVLLLETCPPKLLAYQGAHFPTQTAAPRYMPQSAERP